MEPLNIVGWIFAGLGWLVICGLVGLAFSSISGYVPTSFAGRTGYSGLLLFWPVCAVLFVVALALTGIFCAGRWVVTGKGFPEVTD